jgi:hypothetical protein
VYSGTDWVPLASEVTNLSGYYTKGEIDILDAPTGLKMIVPSSVAVGSGSGSANAAGQVTFSGASSVSLNDVFSSTYDNYRFILNCTQSATTGLYMYMRTGSTNTATGYAQAGWSYKSDGATGTFAGNANRNEIQLGDGDTNEEYYVGDIQCPYLAKNTAIQHQGMSPYQNKALISTTILKNTTSYDAINIFPGSGTITGTVSVYGYKD